jgi:hypothetical protein
MRSTNTSTMLQGRMFIDVASKLKLNIKEPGPCHLLRCGGGIEPVAP